MKLLSIERPDAVFSIEINQAEVDVIVALMGGTNSLGAQLAIEATESLYRTLETYRDVEYRVMDLTNSEAGSLHLELWRKKVTER